MTFRQINLLRDVVDWGLCLGCGTCFYACENKAITLVNIELVGIRPQFGPDCASCGRCLAVCPGAHLAAPASASPDVGPVLEVWEGHAVDPDLRRRSSSGGILSALALYCLEQENMDGVLHTAMDESKPWANRTVVSKNRAEIVARCGSRYAPSSPGEALGTIETGERPYVFIGKPCDAAALAQAAELRPALRQNLGLSLALFCAGTPSSRGTLDLLASSGVAPDAVREIRYRGDGWPGEFRVFCHDGRQVEPLTYQESWGRLAGYRQWRCHLCPEGLGQFADIASGDAWERSSDAKGDGHSIVIVRTERGREILRKAREANYVALEPVGAQQIRAAQPNLLRRNREIAGRLLAMKLLWTPTPRYQGFDLHRAWKQMPFGKRVRIVLGTLRRLLTRGFWRKRPLR